MKDLNFSYKNSWFWVLFVVFFSSGFVFFKVPFEFYFHYIIIIFLTPLYFFKYGFPKLVIQLFIVPLIVGIIHILLSNNLSFTFWKVFGGLLSVTLFFYYAIHHNNFNIRLVFKWYCKATYLLCLIAGIQIISFLLGIKSGYDFSWFLNKWSFVEGGIVGFRVNSLLSEPTYLATVLAPSVFISVKNLLSKQNFIFNKLESIIIILTSILTTSSIGYLGIIASFLLASNTIRIRYILIGLLISVFSFNMAYWYVPDFRNRVDAAKGLWIDKNFSLSNTNNSSFVLYNNLHIAKENLINYPLFGTGLGSHETAFKKHTLTKTVIKYDFEFNIKDGNSLFVRLSTETGLVGLFFVFLLIYKGFIYKVKYDDEDLRLNSMISQSLFILFILVLVRQGNYMLNGLPMLFLIYYYNFIEYKTTVEKKYLLINP